VGRLIKSGMAEVTQLDATEDEMAKALLTQIELEAAAK